MARLLALLLLTGLAAAALGAQPPRMATHRKLFNAYAGSTAQHQLKAQLPGFTLPSDQCDETFSGGDDACPADKPFVGCCINGSCDVNPNPGAVCIEFDADSETARACCPRQSPTGAPGVTQQSAGAAPTQQSAEAAAPDSQQNATTTQEQPNGTTTGSTNAGQRRKLAQDSFEVPMDQCDRYTKGCPPDKPFQACCDETTNMCDANSTPGRQVACITDANVSFGCCPGPSTGNGTQTDVPVDTAPAADTNPGTDP